MAPDHAFDRERQLALLGEVLSRPDLTRGEIVVFRGMRFEVERGVVLSDPQKNWLNDVKRRPLHLEVEAPQAESDRRLQKATDWIVTIVAIVFVSGLVLYLLTFLMHHIGWR
jgi:hypothetical protein